MSLMSSTIPASRWYRVLPLFVSVAVAAFWWHRTGARWAGGLLVATATLALASILSPRIAQAVDRFFKATTRHALRATTFVLLGAVFVIIFVPGGLLRRLRGTDPVRKHDAKNCESYWQSVAERPEHYERQY
jgi:hypothetical protein